MGKFLNFLLSQLVISEQEKQYDFILCLMGIVHTHFLSMLTDF